MGSGKYRIAAPAPVGSAHDDMEIRVAKPPWFTATKGGAIGAAGAFLFALWRRSRTWRSLLECTVETARTTGALLFSQFMNFAGLPDALKEAVTAFGAQPLVVISMILLLYVVLGTFFEELSMVLLTVPIFYPLVVNLGFDPIWFGIVIVMVVELGLISPPVGMNLFVVQSMLKTPIALLWRWITPFALADVIRLAVVSRSRSWRCSCPG